MLTVPYRRFPNSLEGEAYYEMYVPLETRTKLWNDVLVEH